MTATSDINFLIPKYIERILGPAPLVHGESVEDYRSLLSQFAAAVDPDSIIDWLQIKDVVDLTWEIIRYRRVKAEIIDLEIPFAAAPLVRRVLIDKEKHYGPTIDSLRLQEAQNAILNAMGEPAFAETEVAESVTQLGLPLTSFSSSALVSKLDVIEAIDRLVARAEKRRDSVLQEIERRQAAFGGALRKAANDSVVDVPAQSSDSAA